VASGEWLVARGRDPCAATRVPRTHSGENFGQFDVSLCAVLAPVRNEVTVCFE
jgi:hypothetical protein